MKQIQVIDIKHRKVPTYANKVFGRLTLAIKCLRAKQVALTYIDYENEIIHTKYLNFSQKDVGYVLRTIGQGLYDSACALEEAEQIIKN